MRAEGGPSGGRGEALNLINARYGTEPGVKAYSHISGRFSPFATQTIPATVHEPPYILDGLLMNETGRRVREQYADTGGFTDHRRRPPRMLADPQAVAWRFAGVDRWGRGRRVIRWAPP